MHIRDLCPKFQSLLDSDGRLLRLATERCGRGGFPSAHAVRLVPPNWLLCSTTVQHPIRTLLRSLLLDRHSSERKKSQCNKHTPRRQKITTMQRSPIVQPQSSTARATTTKVTSILQKLRSILRPHTISPKRLTKRALLRRSSPLI